MKISSSIAVCSLAMFSVPFEMSAQSRVFVDPFLSAPAFQIAGGVNDLRVAESYRIAPPEESTHILIEGLVPIEVGSNVVVSNYTGINLNTGEVKDVGSLYFTMPPNAPAPDAASSPIVGIVARNGSWDGLTSAPPATPIGGSIGNIHIDMQASTLVFNIAGYTGTAHYSRIDNFTLQIDDFRLSNGGANLDFYGAQFSLYRGDLYGIVQTKNPLNENARLFELRINHLEDYDGDQIPDLLDEATGPFSPVIGGDKFDRTIGWMWGDSAQWAYAYFTYRWVYTVAYPWMWIDGQGWVWAGRDFSDNGTIWLWHDARQEYIMTRTDGWRNNAGTSHFWSTKQEAYFPFH